jgi:hypothetical protein
MLDDDFEPRRGAERGEFLLTALCFCLSLLCSLLWLLMLIAPHLLS